MSYQPLWLRDLIAYSIQAAALVGVGILMASLLRLRVPRVRLGYWQALLAVCVFLPMLQPWRPEILDRPSFAMSSVTLAAIEAAPAPAGPSLAEIVLWLICAGVVLRLAWMALGLCRLWLYRRHAERINQTPEAIREAQRLVPASSAFFISRQIPTPATFGFLQPAILFPARFLEMEPAMQKAIALHELLHVERRDWLWNMFEEVVLTLLWFHLPLWWVVRSARLSREQVVDAEAVQRSHARRPYLKALLEMAGQKRLAESLPAPLFLRENQLAERVALMMKEVHMSRTRLTVSILTASMTLLIAGATLVWAFPLKTSAPQPETPAVASPAAQSSVSDTSETSLPANAPPQETDSSQKLSRVYKVGGNVKAPDPVYMPNPPYTPEARKNHLTGTIVLSCVIDTKGRVVEVEERSEPLGQGLDEKAINTVRTWKFKPGTRNGVPVPVRVQAEVTFRLYGKQGEDSAKPDPQPNSQPQVKRPTPEASKDNGPSVNINQAEIHRQVEEVMKQARIAQEAATKIDQKKMQQQMEEAMKQLQKMNTPEIRQRFQQQMKQLEKLNTAEMQRHMQEQMKQLEKMNTPEMRRQMQAQMEQLRKMNTPEMRKQMEEAMKQLKMAQMAAPKIDEAQIRQQVEQAMEQAKIAQESAAKESKAELQRQLEQARKQIEQARKETQAAREEARKAQQEAMKARREAEEQRKAAKPAPSAAPKPAPAPPKDITPPPAPPAPPAPPKIPESASIVGGSKGSVIAAPHVPVPPSPAPKIAIPAPPPPSPAPPTPQN